MNQSWILTQNQINQCPREVTSQHYYPEHTVKAMASAATLPLQILLPQINFKDTIKLLYPKVSFIKLPSV